MDIKNLTKAKGVSERLSAVDGALHALTAGEAVEITIGKFKMPAVRARLAPMLMTTLEEMRTGILQELRDLGVEAT